MKSWQIRIKGVVQGVGFRPTVYRLALQANVRGEVSNGPNGVLILFNGDRQKAEEFYTKIIEKAPKLSKITFRELREIQARSFANFSIVESRNEGEREALFTPDFGICEDCRADLRDPKNRRHQYAFITCTLCGPRYSIIQNLPYDRHLTAMQPYEMCESCQEEYLRPEDRRYFSQSNSCPSCGVKLNLRDRKGDIPLNTEQEKLNFVVDSWEKGKIIAIKGIGGYLLTCDASNEAAILQLRARKQRPAKPLALMYPSIEDLKVYDLSPTEQAELLSEVSPILLLKKKDGYKLPESIASDLDSIGIMLPYTPLYEILLSKFRKAIIATSANISNSPIIFESDRSEELLQIADLMLDNDREIVLPQDDSVIRYSKFHQKRIVLRRSRGLAPSFFGKTPDIAANAYLACGADMKSSFAIFHQKQYYISQYLGDLGHFDTELSFRKVMKHMEKVLKPEVKAVIHDLHPNYVSTRIAEELAESQQQGKIAIQHHKAHFSAILGEHELIDSSEKILGVIWDGTGYGEDGNTWGGEFFLYQEKKIKRTFHLAYFPSFGGDKFAKEPRMSLFSLLPDQQIVRDKFSESELRIFDKLSTTSHIKSSSMGRLFDAVSSLLGICDIQSYEAEAAMKLEKYALSFFAKDLAFEDAYEIPMHGNSFEISTMLRSIIAELNEGIPKEQIAAKFHNSLIVLIEKVATKLAVPGIALSGGVFQNALLVDLCIERLRQKFELYFHEQLSPNDENIAYGQLIYAQYVKTED